MKSSRRARFSSSSHSTSTVTFLNEHSTPGPQTKTKEIPNHSPSDELPKQSQSQDHSAAAAVKIQSAYRSYVVRTLVGKISVVNSEANYWERLIQRQEIVDAVRTSETERIKINEALMHLLLRLDSMPGVDPTVRELRWHVSRRIVGLQEILDAVSDARVEIWDGFLKDWDDVLVRIEKEVCQERGGGHEMEQFCVQHLGFHCLQRFLRDQ